MQAGSFQFVVHVLRALLLSGLVLSISACGRSGNSAQDDNQTSKASFVILSGSENETLEPMIKAWADKRGYAVRFVYKGSVDIMQLLRGCPKEQYDAVWPASSIWIAMGDTQHCVKHAESILITPVTFNIALSKAREFGFVGKPVHIADIADKVRKGKLRFMMTSATQSNSGASAYLGFLYALAGNPDVLTQKDLERRDVKLGVQALLSGVNRSAGSSGWLKTAFLQGNYNAMVNYESVAIETNQELIKQGREPLYAVYPVDGLVLADSPLGYLNSGDTKKEQFFKDLRTYLAQPETVDALAQLGRRSGFDALNLHKTHPEVFKPDWGMGGDHAFSPIKLPSADVIENALLLYQQELRKPSLTAFALDFSGSMHSNGGEAQLKQAMAMLLDPVEAKRYWLQTTERDVVIVIPFNNSVIDRWESDGPSQMGSMLERLTLQEAYGGTAIYDAGIEALRAIHEHKDLENYTVSVVLMTDGESNEGSSFAGFQQAYAAEGMGIPVYTIGFGSANEADLKAIAKLSNAQYFGAKQDLVGAFRKVRGYN